MNGSLAQIVCLVSHGNSYLNGGNVDLSKNTTFQHVSRIEFARYKNNKAKHGKVIARNVSDWFTFLRSLNVTRLWTIAFDWQNEAIPEHVADHFANYVQRTIQADLPNGFELWYPKWSTVGHSKRAGWRVEYRSLMFSDSQALPVQKMSLVKNHLKKAVSQAEAFSKREDVNESYWATWFTKSLELLDSSAPTVPYHNDVLPASGYSLEARQILASATQAHVFGGMGSWNELGFEKPEIHQEYERVSKELYAAIKYSILMASNSFEL
jgi:hypothetical protein